jgi:hypothetical protein
MLRPDAPAETLRELRRDVPEGLKEATAFITEAITKNNRLVSAKFLRLPDERTLRALYTVEIVLQNLYADEPKDSKRIVDSAIGLDIPRSELVLNYYDKLFTSAGNKNGSGAFSGVDFKLKDLGLTNESDAAIFYLACVSHLNSFVWGYINIAKPMNTKEAYAQIRKFPRFNGLPYYQFTELSFPDFLTVTDAKEGPQSFKRHYIDKLYELLLIHVLSLEKEGGSDEARTDLLLSSILRQQKYYRYTALREDLEKLFGEGPLQFNKRFMDCENQWVAVQPDSTGLYRAVFVYVDESAGPTVQLGASFRISDAGAYTDVSRDTISIKIRLEEPSTHKVALLPESALKALGLPAMPDWLPVYLEDTGTVKSLVKRGYLYNAWDRPDLALIRLKRAQSKDPHAPGMAMELAYAYNALGQYAAALTTLKESPEAKSDACYYYKEYTYAQLKLGNTDAAAELYNGEAAKACNDKVMKAEMAYNIAAEYFLKKNREAFRKWAVETRRWAEPGDRFNQALERLEK